MWHVRCSVCGRFCIPTDYSYPFASGNSCEQPDPEYYCRECVGTQFAYYLKIGRVPDDWIKAKWHHALARRLGLVEVVEGINAWSYWKKRNAPLKPREHIVFPKELKTPRETWDR